MSRTILKSFAFGAALTLLIVGGLWYATEHILPYSPIRPHRVTREEIAKYHQGTTTPSSLGMKFDKFDVLVGDHYNLTSAGGEAYREKVFGFLKANLRL